MATPRWSTKSFTAVAGNPIQASDINTEHDRIVTLADDIGGDPGSDYNGDETDIIDALNAHLLFKPIPKMVSGAMFRPRSHTDSEAAIFNDRGKVYNGIAYGTDPDIELVAELDLPVGTYINAADLWGSLTHTGASISVALAAYNPSTDTYHSGIATVTKTSFSSGDFHETFAFSAHTILEGFQYFLLATITNGDAASQAHLHGVQVKKS